jgi:DNA polymerase III subunit beta
VNIAVKNSVLLQELRVLGKIAAAKPTIPVLSHILFRAEDGIHLAATDLEVAMTSSCEGAVQEMGSTTIPAKTLLDMLERLSPDETVSIIEAGGTVRLAAGSFKSRLPSLPSTDFPAMPEPEGDVAPIKASVMATLIDRTRYAISDKTTQYALNGSFLSLSGPVMAMVATDGQRLSVATASRAEGPDRSVIIPSKTLEVLQSHLLGDIAFSTSDRHLFFGMGKRQLASRTLDGQFPKYQRIIPKANNISVVMNRLALMAVVRRVGTVAELMSMHLRPGAVTFAARSAERGDADESISIAYDGAELQLGFYWKHLIDFMEKAVQPSVTFALKDGVNPIMVTDGSDYLNVILPVRV